MARLKRLSTAFLSALRYELDEADGELGFALPVPPGQAPVQPPIQPEFYVKSPFDGADIVEPVTAISPNVFSVSA